MTEERDCCHFCGRGVDEADDWHSVHFEGPEDRPEPVCGPCWEREYGEDFRAVGRDFARYQATGIKPNYALDANEEEYWI